MVAGVDHGNSFKRDMGYSENEFFRILPNAVKGFSFLVRNDEVIVSDSEQTKELTIRVDPLPDRKIGMISIPRIEVEFRFRNFSEIERVEFLKNFDRSYQRGGG